MNDQTTKPKPVPPPRVLNVGRHEENPRVMWVQLDRDVDLEAFPALADQLAQMGDRAMRMELALRCIRLWGMIEIALPHSAAVRDWLRDWIDGAHQWPSWRADAWPVALHAVTHQLKLWGFENGDGYVVLRRAPAEGEAVQ